MPFLLYGATGYTGRLIAALAVERGHQPVLAGRTAGTLRPLAERLGLDATVVPLDDARGLDRALAGVPAVLHAAGPFAHTARPMVEACLRTGTHYLDITGEIAVFEALHARDQEARGAGVTVLPGVGFDVVPTDCLALHLHGRLPSATRLRLAIRALSEASHGTARTAVENAGEGGAVRREGRIVRVPAAHEQITATFSDGATRTCTAIPWGDVSTAYHTTGIPSVTTYAALPPGAVRAMRASRYLGPVLRSAPVQGLLRRLVEARVSGPSEEDRAGGRSFVWCEAVDGDGHRVVSRWSGPEGYTLTADTALRAALRVSAGETEPGFQTPGLAFGADFALEPEGTAREDVA